MLVTSAVELANVYPNSRFTNINNLSSLFENVERGIVQQVLGYKLLRKLIDDYKKLIEEYGGIWADKIEDPDDKVYIIRAVQSVEIYFTLCDNVGILSSSLNQGGGFNQATASGYEELSNDVRKTLANDLYHAARRALEQLLSLLEEDAANEKLYTELWKDSSYYFYQQNLLFPTAYSMHPHYLNLGNEPHSKFISIIGNLYDCQERHIALVIGDAILNDLRIIAHGNSIVPPLNEPTDEPTEPVDEPTDEPTEPVDEPTEPVDELTDEPTEPTDEDLEDAKRKMLVMREEVLRKSLPYIKRALAHYVSAELETDMKSRERIYLVARDFLNRAIRYYIDNPELFHDELSTDLDAIYKAKFGRGIDDPDPNEKKKDKGFCRCQSHHGKAELGNQRDTVVQFGGLGLHKSFRFK